ncbi:MAG: hypothetical protein GXY55_06945, partial [Phycisphaerae bacterium]|nr:hypothetical protein [Phycisphaerae bacterium]
MAISTTGGSRMGWRRCWMLPLAVCVAVIVWQRGWAQDPAAEPPAEVDEATAEQLIEELDQQVADPYYIEEQAAQPEVAYPQEGLMEYPDEGEAAPPPPQRGRRGEYRRPDGQYGDPGARPDRPGYRRRPGGPAVAEDHEPVPASESDVQIDPADAEYAPSPEEDAAAEAAAAAEVPADAGIRLDASGMPEVSEQDLREIEQLLNEAAAQGIEAPPPSDQAEPPPPPPAPEQPSPETPEVRGPRRPEGRPMSPRRMEPSPSRPHSARPEGSSPAVPGQPGVVPPSGEVVEPVPETPSVSPDVRPVPAPATPATPAPAVGRDRPTSRPATGAASTQPATPTVPAVQPIDDTSNAPADAVARDSQTGLPDLKADPKWWVLPAEERPYFFSWKETPVDRMFADLSQMSGLSMKGLNLLDVKGAKPITFQSTKLMEYDEALLTFNLLVMDMDYWVLQRDAYLEVRRLTEWYRHIPPSRMFSSLEAYRAAKLPDWELVAVRYEPKEESARTLAERAVDLVPLNTARATVIPDSNRIELKGFAYYVNQQLEYIVDADVVGSGDGREVRVYMLKFATPEDATRLLEAMMPPMGGSSLTIAGAPAPAGGRSPRTPAAPAATPDPGSSSAENVDITTDSRLNRLLVRATPAKHKLVAEYLEKHIDLANEGGQTEVLTLQHADPTEVVEIIRPMLGEQQLVQPPAPAARPGQPQPAAPPPRMVTVGSTAQLTPVPHIRSILVKAPPDEMAQIKRFIEILDVPAEESKYQYVKLEHASATTMASILTTALGGRSSRSSYMPGGRSSGAGSGQQVFSAVPDAVGDRGLVLTGELKDVTDAKALIAELDVDPEAGAVEHLVLLKNASASSVGSLLQTRFGGSSGGAARSYGYRPGYGGGGGGGGGELPKFIPDDESKTLIVVSREQMWPDIERFIREIDSRTEVASTLKPYRLQYASASTLTSILSQSFGGTAARWSPRGFGAPSGPSFQFEPQSNTVIVSANDETHAKVAVLIGELDRPGPSDQVELRAIQLERADVDYVVQKLQEIFPSTTGGRSPYGSFSFRGAGSGPEKPPVQIVAETVSNRILITSTEEDFKKAETFAQQMDREYEAKNFVRKTFTIKFADSSQIQSTIQSMFMSEGGGGGGGGGSRWGSWFGRSSSTTTPGGIRMSEVGNSIVVLAPADKMAEIETLITTLDVDPATRHEIRTYKLTATDSQGTAGVARNLEQLFAVSASGSRRWGQSSPESPKFIGNYGSDVLMVSAPSEKMEEIDGIIQEMLKSQVSQDMTLIIRHIDIEQAEPRDVAEMVDPILKSKFQEMRQQAGGGGGRFSYYGGGQDGPQVTAHRTAKRVMVSAPASLMPLVEELIHEFDQPAQASTMRIVQLETAKPEEVARIVEEQVGRRGGSGSSFYRSYGRWSPFGGGAAASSSGTDDLTVTPVEASRLVILRGPEKKVYEAEQLIRQLDAQARPEGPIIKVYELQYADVYDVVSTLEQMVSGATSGSGYGSMASYGGGRTRGGAAGDGQVVIQSDTYGKRIIVSAPYDKIPLITEIIEMKEEHAKPTEGATLAGRRGAEQIGPPSRDSVTMSYKIEKGSADDFARALDRILIDRFGYWDSPYVKSFPFGNEVIVTGKPEQFKEVEHWLDMLEENPPTPRIMLMVKQVKGGNAGKVVQMVTQSASPELQQKLEVQEIPQLRGRRNPLDMIQEREVHHDDPVTNGSSSPYVPTGALSALRDELASLHWAAGARITVATKPASQPAADAKPPATQPAKEKAPASAPAPAAQTRPAPVAAAPPAPQLPTVEEPSGQLPDDESRPDQARQAVQEAAAEAFASGNTQVKYDEETGLIYIVGPSSDLERLQTTFDTVIKQFEEMETEVASDIRVFRMRYLDVSIAATILEQMFNDRQTQQPGARQPGARQPGAPQPGDRQTASADRGQQEEEGSAGSRRREEEEERTKQEQEQARALAGGQRIRVFPNPRDQTLVVRAVKDDFPLVAELLLKIDRPAGRDPVDVRIFQLKQLNAAEVERAIKAILKIEDRQTRTTRPRIPTGRQSGGPGAMGADAMIEELEQQMFEMQAAILGERATGEQGTGTVRLNPAKDITITSDATTNSIIVSAPPDGMTLVEKLINKLESQQIPTQIRTFPLEHADAPKVAEQLQRVFGEAAGGRTRGRGGEEGITPARMGTVSVSADERTNSLVIRALAPDMEKVEPILRELDVAPGLDRLVQLYQVEHGDARAMAETLKTIFVDDAKATGARAIRITADVETNTIVVWAPETQQKSIETQIKSLDQMVGERATPRQIQLRVASAVNVAEKLQQMFGGGRTAGGRGAAAKATGRQQVTVIGDDASKILFVTAPPELFEEISKAAELLDQTTTSDIQVFKLEHAAAADVLSRFKEMMAQIMQQAGRGAMTDVFAVSADERTNSLIVAGTPAIFLMVEKVLGDLDSTPSDATAVATQMFPLTRGNAASVAATISSLYGGKVWHGGAQAPRAAAEPTANVVYVTGTKAQIDQIKANVIDPLEGYVPTPPPAITVNDYQIPVKYAKVEELATTLTTLFTQRFAALVKAGDTSRPPAETTISILPEPSTRMLLVTCTESNKAVIDSLLETLDVEEVTDRGQQTRVVPVKFADLGYTAQALTTTFNKGPRVPASEQVTIAPEYGTQSVIIKAPADDMEQILALLAQIDRSDATTAVPTPETIRLENARASDVAKMLTDMIARSKRRDRTTGTYPVNVTADDTSNTLLLAANSAKDMEEMKALIQQFDVEPPTEEQRVIRPYDIQFADLTSAVQAINLHFKDNARRPVQDQVVITPDHVNSKLMITASPANQEKVATIIKELDVSNVQRTVLPKTVKLAHAKASDVAATMTSMIQRSKRRDRTTGMYPITVMADDLSNSLIVTANERDMKEAEELIAQLDLPPATDEERSV